MKILNSPPAELALKIAPIRKKMQLEATKAPIAIYRKKIRTTLPEPVLTDP